MKFKLLTHDLYIADQLTFADLENAAELGIKTIINNRPDQEEENQPLSSELEQAAKTLGLNYYYIPIYPGKFTHDDAEKFAQILDENPAPYLAFCRTGNRSCNLWALSHINIHNKEKLHQWANNIGVKLTTI